MCKRATFFLRGTRSTTTNIGRPIGVVELGDLERTEWYSSNEVGVSQTCNSSHIPTLFSSSTLDAILVLGMLGCGVRRDSVFRY